MIADNTKRLLLGIIIVLVLLSVCVSVDYASENNTTAIVVADNQTVNLSNITNVKVLNDSHCILVNGSGTAKLNKVVVEKEKVPVIAMTGKPSCTRCSRNGVPYRWFTKKYVNYCPNCKHWNCLGNKHKRGAVHEKEISCFRCDSDFCICCGKEKYSWSRVYLRKA